MRTYEKCPRCRKRVAVKTNGALWLHTTGRTDPCGSRFSPVCDGSGSMVIKTEKPTEASS